MDAMRRGTSKIVFVIIAVELAKAPPIDVF